MKPDALVFDLDGTLWDAAEATARGWNLALEKLGVAERVDVAGIQSVCGTPFFQCAETLLPTLSPPTEALLTALESGERVAIEASGGVLYPGVREGLPALASTYRLFLVSNCPGWYLDAFLEMSGLRGCFTGWDCHGASGLPKADMLAALRERHGLVRAVYVGDTQGDRDSAVAGGMGFVFARYGFGTVAEPVPAFDSFADLIDHFLD
jgi:phosphoglycolate phosphatase